MTDAKTFVLLTNNVHVAKHGEDFIYVGHDVANRWSAFFSGTEEELGSVDTLEHAQIAAHRLLHAGASCSLNLEWELIPQTEIKDLRK
jgi:hypothetical protein